MPENIQIDGDRLWHSIMEMGKIGGLANGGSCRLCLSEEDIIARNLFVDWCRDADCDVKVDRAGNIFATRPGARDLPPVAAGSHLDTQPHGGRFDGIFGVLAGLEVIRTLNDHGIATDHPVAVINWTNEEGVRYSPGLLGSSAYAGTLSLSELHDIRSTDGTRFGDDLRHAGFDGTIMPGDFALAALYEAHIEQGPVLEKEGLQIGIVSKVQGLRWLEVTVIGQDGHAGTVPMDARRDSLTATAHMMVKLEQLCRRYLPDIRLTVGKLHVSPNSGSTIPGKTEFNIDLRHPDAAVLDELETEITDAIAEIAAARGLEATVEKQMEQPPVHFDDALLETLRDAAASLSMPVREMLSGALHDAARVAAMVPSAMLFIPCKGGVSHNEAEWAAPAHVEAGANVLARAIVARAGRA